MGYLKTENGIYDMNSNRSMIEDIIQTHLNSGGKIERKFEDTEIFEIVDGQIRKSIRKADVIKLIR